MFNNNTETAAVSSKDPSKARKPSSSVIILDEKTLLKSTQYAAELESAVGDSVNPETTIYLLKNQLIEAAIFNHNLKRVVSFLIWRLNVERANASIKGEMGTALQKTVHSLEDLLKKYSEKRHQWKQELERFDYDIMCLKNQLESRKGGDCTTTFGAAGKPRLRKAINKREFMRQSTCRLLDGTGRCLGMMFSPRARAAPQRQMSGTDFTKLAEAAGGGKTSTHKVVNAIPLSSFGAAAAEQSTKPEPDKIVIAAAPVVPEEVAGNANNKLESELHEAKLELACSKTLADLLSEELDKTRGKLSTLRGQIGDITQSAEQAIKDENNSWKTITDSLKVTLFCFR